MRMFVYRNTNHFTWLNPASDPGLKWLLFIVIACVCVFISGLYKYMNRQSTITLNDIFLDLRNWFWFQPVDRVQVWSCMCGHRMSVWCAVTHVHSIHLIFFSESISSDNSDLMIFFFRFRFKFSVFLCWTREPFTG